MSAAIKIIRQGYGDVFAKAGKKMEADRSLGFRVDITAEDLPAVRGVESYNAFRGEDVADVLAKILHDKIAYSVSFGREGSPVVYLWVKSDEDQKTVLRLLKGLEPDELDVVGNNTIRAWWD